MVRMVGGGGAFALNAINFFYLLSLVKFIDDILIHFRDRCTFAMFLTSCKIIIILGWYCTMFLHIYSYTLIFFRFVYVLNNKVPIILESYLAFKFARASGNGHIKLFWKRILLPKLNKYARANLSIRCLFGKGVFWKFNKLSARAIKN